MNNQYADSVPTPSLDSEASAIAGFLTPELADAFALVASGAQEPGDLERLLDLLRAALRGPDDIHLPRPAMLPFTLQLTDYLRDLPIGWSHQVLAALGAVVVAFSESEARVRLKALGRQISDVLAAGSPVTTAA